MFNKNNTLPLGLLFVHLHILKSFTVTYNIDQGSGMGIGCGEVGRLVERSFLTPEIRGSIPAIGNYYIEHY